MSNRQTLNRRRAGDRTIAVVLCALTLTGCHNRVPISFPGANPTRPGAAVSSDLKAGDHVRVMTRVADAEFVIAEVQPEALVAKDGRRFAYADIVRVERIRLALGKTVALTASLVFLGLSAAMSIAVASAFGSWGAP